MGKAGAKATPAKKPAAAAAAVPPGSSGPPGSSRSRLPLVAGIAVLVALAAVGVVFFQRGGPPSDAPRFQAAAGQCCTPAPEKTAAAAAIKVGLISTMKNVPAAQMYQWICYHLRLGFERVYIYIDRDPSLSSQIDTGEEMALLFGRERVVVTVRDEAFKEWLRGSRIWLKWGPFFHTEVMARQNLHAEHALHVAKADGMDYVLHIDGDELFWPGQAQTVREHFADAKKRRMTSTVYLNYEAVHLSEDADFFLESTLFKRNPLSLQGGHNDQRVARWGNSKVIYMQGYWTGKGTAGLFAHQKPEDLPLPLECTRFYIPNATDMRGNFDGPLILHYINPSLPALKEKYRHLDKKKTALIDKNFVRSAADQELLARSLASKENPLHAPPEESTELAFPLYLKRLATSRGVQAFGAEFHRFAMLSAAEQKTWLSSGVLAHIPDAAKVMRDLMVCAVGEAGVPGEAFKGPHQKELDPPVVQTVPSKCNNNDYLKGRMDSTLCFVAHGDCCALLMHSKGALKTPPYFY